MSILSYTFSFSCERTIATHGVSALGLLRTCYSSSLTAGILADGIIECRVRDEINTGNEQ